MQIFIPYYISFFILYMFISARKIKLSFGTANVFLFLFLFLFVILVGSRDFDLKGDTQTYLRVYYNIKHSIDVGRLEKGFVFLLKMLSFIELTNRQLLYALASLQAFIWYFFIVYFFKDNRKKILFVMLLASSFFIYNTGTNVLRQGFAIPLALLSMAFYINKKWFLSLLFLGIATSFHMTAAIIPLTYLLSQKLKFNLTFYFVILIVFTISSAAGLFEFFNDIFYSTFGDYDYLFSESAFEAYRVGFRPDFWLFSLFPLVLYFFLSDDAKENNLLFIKQYILLFCGFIFLFSFPYSDRFGLYAWVMMLVLVSNFSCSYKIRMHGEDLITALLILTYGLLGFFFSPLMQFNYYL